ncbi:MAG TPA: CPBP family intramembrane glutamic endopeptidase [Chitinophagaceae bacterium]|nr:CPBP family intramembrane glutamic endopeptidase [Chitinophagaceae bacterium]
MIDKPGSIQSNDQFAKELRGFGPVGIIVILIILLTGNIILPNMIVLPIGALIVLLWVRLSNTPLSAIGYTKPKNWFLTILISLIFGVAFKFFMKAIVMPLLGADPVNQYYHFLAGNLALLPAAIVAMLVVGFSEETVFRGFMFERLGKLFGNRSGAKLFIVIITSILFGAAHYMNQGIPGVEQATITGLVYGTIFASTKKIWIVMIAHASFDLTALATIYGGFETDVAHFIFK